VKTFKSKSSSVYVRVLDKEGREVVSWDGREYRTKVDVTVYHRPRGPEARAWERRSAEELFIDGQLEERMGSSLLAELKYEQALKADPGFTRALNSLAALYYRRGLYAKAAELLEKSLERDPECCETRYYLGLCRLKLGDPLWRGVRVLEGEELPALLHAILVLDRRCEDAEGGLRGGRGGSQGSFGEELARLEVRVPAVSPVEEAREGEGSERARRESFG